uniref:Pre-C2HC domain-containing protein n=1 Tax=Phlebotomus papatasi TaxID=29031 RepID=A0A1B0DG16_PHLPP
MPTEQAPPTPGSSAGNDDTPLTTTGADIYRTVKRKRSPKSTRNLQPNSPVLNGTPISTSNRFSSLATKKNINSPSSTNQQTARTEKPKPFYVREERYISSLNDLMKHLRISTYDIKILRGGLEARLQVSTVDEYRLIQKAFDSAKTPYYTFQLKSERPLKVAIKGIPPNMSPDCVSRELIALGFNPRRVSNALNRRGEKSSVFMVELNVDDAPANKTHPIYNMKRFMHLVVEVEQPHRRRSPIQCFNCQEFGHTKNSGRHSTVSCPADKQDASAKKCNNCGENHTANWRGCVVYHEFLERMNPRQRREQRIENNKYRLNRNRDQEPTPQQNTRRQQSYADVTANKNQPNPINSGSESISMNEPQE